MFRLILAKGADPNAVDTNGNNVCHMMVILDKMDMFNMAFETGAHAHMFNNQVETRIYIFALKGLYNLFQTKLYNVQQVQPYRKYRPTKKVFY